MRRANAVVLGLALGVGMGVGLSGCGQAEAPPASSSSASSSSSSSTSPAVASIATGEPVMVGVAANGTTVHVSPGAPVIVTLDNTYWRFGTPTGVLRATGEQVVKAATPGTCLPGVGCGTVALTVTAASAGRGDVTASRTSCGEAMACEPGQGSWVVHVVVG